MKKTITIGILVVAAILAIGAALSMIVYTDQIAGKVDISEIVIKGDNGKRYTSYQHACNDGEYVTAYRFVEEMKNQKLKAEASGEYYYDDRPIEHLESEISKAERYIILHEGMKLLENGNNASLIRIAALVKEYNADWLYDELIEVARAIGDEDLVNRLTEMQMM